MRTPKAKAQQRPAETGSAAAAAVVVVIVWAAHIDDPAVVAALVVLMGALPSAITWAVNLARGRAVT